MASYNDVFYDDDAPSWLTGKEDDDTQDSQLGLSIFPLSSMGCCGSQDVELGMAEELRMLPPEFQSQRPIRNVNSAGRGGKGQPGNQSQPGKYTDVDNYSLNLIP
ncbi:hypothetical protein R1sor_011800 [Riccia sorocarpa]|uniref:Uncharacterized protein n=1 Tax=Riccia sorocarpa TaxID=122646 RepID=A0ABD3I5C8_9MARC